MAVWVLLPRTLLGSKFSCKPNLQGRKFRMILTISRTCASVPINLIEEPGMVTCTVVVVTHVLDLS